MRNLVNGHDHAIALQKEKTDIFIKQFHDLCEPHLHLIEEVLEKNNQIFNRLRSKIYPENRLSQFAQHVHESYVEETPPMTLIFILASPTATKELPPIIQFIKLFCAFKVKPIIHFLFVEWPDLESLKNQDMEKIHQKFNLSFEETKTIINQYVDKPSINVLNYNQIVKYVAVSEKALLHDKDFQTDLAWIEGFYEREDSCYKFCSKQAFFDLGARRLVALYSQDNIPHFNKFSDRIYLITTELNKRFLKCYRSPYTILNITVNHTNA